VSHHRGSTEGGLLVSIEGTGLSYYKHKINVTIDDVPCRVVDASDEEVKCVTGKRDFILNPPLKNTKNLSQTLPKYIGNHGAKRRIWF